MHYQRPNCLCLYIRFLRHTEAQSGPSVEQENVILYRSYQVDIVQKNTTSLCRLSPGQLVALATDVAEGLSYMEARGYVHK